MLHFLGQDSLESRFQSLFWLRKNGSLRYDIKSCKSWQCWFRVVPLNWNLLLSNLDYKYMILSTESSQNLGQAGPACWWKAIDSNCQMANQKTVISSLPHKSRTAAYRMTSMTLFQICVIQHVMRKKKDLYISRAWHIFLLDCLKSILSITEFCTGYEQNEILKLWDHKTTASCTPHLATQHVPRTMFVLESPGKS